LHEGFAERTGMQFTARLRLPFPACYTKACSLDESSAVGRDDLIGVLLINYCNNGVQLKMSTELDSSLLGFLISCIAVNAPISQKSSAFVNIQPVDYAKYNAAVS
jgi:hypothetical protein